MISHRQKILLDLLSARLFGREVPPPDPEDALPVAEEALDQTVFTMVYAYLAPFLTGKDEERFRECYLSTLSDNLLNLHQHGELHRRMARYKIPYVIIKGMASASYYEEPLLRNSGDVDFLIRRRDIEKTKNMLLSEGYRMDPNHHHPAHLAFHKGEEILEMHWEPNGLPKGQAGNLCRRYLSKSFSNSHRKVMGDEKFRVQDDFCHGLVLLIHTAAHMIDTGVGLRHLCDWAVFAAKFSDEEYRALFEEKLKAVGLWHFSCLLTRLAITWLGCPEKAWASVGEDERFLEAMMEDVFAAGNFGCKDKERINEAKLMTTKSSATVDGRNLFFRLLQALTEKAETEMPVCKRVILLRPVGWIYVSIRHLRLVMEGKKPELHLGKMIKGAKWRRSIYREFHLYEIHP